MARPAGGRRAASSARPLSRRARSEAAKQARRSAILSSAAEQLARGGYDSVTMASIARAAGVAKGTPYLYWQGKAELFLEVLSLEYQGFVGALIEGLAGLPKPDERSVGQLIAREVHARPGFVSLMGLLHGVLEDDVDVEQVVSFKRAILLQGLEVARQLRRVFPWLSFERARRLVLTIHGAILAFRRMSDTPPGLREALAHPDLALLRVDLVSEVRDLVADLLVAARVDALGEEPGGG